MYIKKILIDLDGVLNEYGYEKYNENYIPPIKMELMNLLKSYLKKLNYIFLHQEI